MDRLLRWTCAAALAIGAAGMAAAAEKESPYALSGMVGLNCEQINDKLEEGKKLGDPEAFYTAAQLLPRKLCFRYVHKTYVALLQQAVDRGHHWAKGDLGYSYAVGEGVAQNYQTAGELLLQAYEENGVDPYTFGYASSLARLTHRKTLTLPRYTFRHEHRLRIQLRVNPKGSSTVDVVQDEKPSAEAESESPEAIRVARRIAQDALDTALRDMPKPDRDRLQDMTLSADWRIGFLHDRILTDGHLVRVSVARNDAARPN